MKKAAILGLLALASSLFLVIPDGEQEPYALEASADEDGEGDGAANSTPTSLQEVAGETGESSEADTARLALATEAALSGAEHSLKGGSAIIAFADEMATARAAAASFGRTSTTALRDKAPAAPKTTRAKAAPVTMAAAATSSSSTEAPATTEDATADTGTSETSSGDTTSETTAETSSPDTTPAETSVPETTIPATTTPETTAPETTAAGNGWVDTGNGVAVPPVLLAIRYCESRDNYSAANPASSARGAYQFLTGSWAAYGHKDRYGVSQAHLASRAQQDEAALITWQRDGTRPWNASRSCWS